MFIEANDVSCKKLKEIYENAFRQKANLSKFAMCLSPNNSKKTKNLALDILGIPFVML